MAIQRIRRALLRLWELRQREPRLHRQHLHHLRRYGPALLLQQLLLERSDVQSSN
jgi:hypothetical protein